MSAYTLILNHILDMSISQKDKNLIAAYLRQELDEMDTAAFELRLIEEPDLKNALIIETAISNSIRLHKEEVFNALFKQAEEDLLLEELIRISVKERKKPKQNIVFISVLGSIAAAVLFLIFIPFSTPQDNTVQRQEPSVNFSTHNTTNTNALASTSLEASPIDPIFASISADYSNTSTDLLNNQISMPLLPGINWNSISHEQQFSYSIRDRKGNPVSIYLEPIPNDYDNISMQFTSVGEIQYRVKMEYQGRTTYSYLKALHQKEEHYVAVLDVSPIASRLRWLYES